MITRKTLNDLVKQISDKTGIPNNSKTAEKENKPHYLWLEYTAHNGGYRLVKVRTKEGGHSGVFGMSSIEPRIKAPVMQALLYGILQGLEFRLTDEA